MIVVEHCIDEFEQLHDSFIPSKVLVSWIHKSGHDSCSEWGMGNGRTFEQKRKVFVV